MELSNMFEIAFMAGYLKLIRFGGKYYCALMNALLLCFDLDKFTLNLMQVITVQELRKENETEWKLM